MWRAYFLFLLSLPALGFEITAVPVKRGGEGQTRFDRVSPIVAVGPLEKIEARVSVTVLSGEQETPLTLVTGTWLPLESKDVKPSTLAQDFDQPYAKLGLTQLGIYKLSYVVEVRNPDAPDSTRSVSTPIVYLPVGVAKQEKVGGTRGFYPAEIPTESFSETMTALAFSNGKMVATNIEVPQLGGVERVGFNEPVGGGVPPAGSGDDTLDSVIRLAQIQQAASIRSDEARAAEAAAYAKRATAESKSLIYYFSNRPDVGVRKGQPWFDSFRYDGNANYAPCVKNYERFGRTNVYLPPAARARGKKGLTGNPLNPFDNDNITVLNEHSPLTGFDLILELWKTPVIVYTHGFNTSFEEALIQAAQMKEDLGWPYAMLVLDWPSFGQADLASYKGDRRMAALSASQVARFMEKLNRGNEDGSGNFDLKLRGTRHFLNHSMGNYVFVNAIRDLEVFGGTTSRIKEGFFNQVVFAAPDVEAKEFTDTLTLLYTKKATDWTTLYYSRKDIAVNISAHIANPFTTRVGVSPVFFPGLTTVNADMVNSSLSSVAGFRHDYYGSADPLIIDLSLLFKYGMSPDRRRPPLTEGTRVGMSDFVLYHVH